MKNQKKKKTNNFLKTPPNLNIDRLDSYPFEEMKEIAKKYYHFSDHLQKKHKSLKEEFNSLLSSYEELKDQNNEVCYININLNNIIMQNALKTDFSMVFKESLNLLLESIGVNDKNFINERKKFEKDFKSLRNNFKKSEIEIKYLFDNKEDIENIKNQISKMKKDLENEFKKIYPLMMKITRFFENFINNLQKLYFNVVSQNKEDLLTDFKFDELLLISKNGFDELLYSASKFKNSSTKNKTELKSLEKKIKEIKSDYDKLKKKNQKQIRKNEKLKRNLEEVEKKHLNERENFNEEELIKGLKKENYDLKVETQKEKSKSFLKDTEIFKLKNSNQELINKLNYLETEKICLLRKEGFKLQQTLRDVKILENKNKDLENLLKSLNFKFEKLYKKNEQLENSNIQFLESLENTHESKYDFKSNSDLFNSHIEIKNSKKNYIKKDSNFNHKILALELQIEAERRVFDEIMQEKAIILDNLEKKIKLCNDKITIITKKSISEKKELSRMSSMLLDNESLLFNEKISNSIFVPSLKKNNLFRKYTEPAEENKNNDLLSYNKIYLQLKDVYKTFVLIVSEDKDERFFELEKKINDTLELVTFYLN